MRGVGERLRSAHGVATVLYVDIAELGQALVRVRVRVRVRVSSSAVAKWPSEIRLPSRRTRASKGFTLSGLGLGLGLG